MDDNPRSKFILGIDGGSHTLILRFWWDWWIGTDLSRYRTTLQEHNVLLYLKIKEDISNYEINQINKIDNFIWNVGLLLDRFN